MILVAAIPEPDKQEQQKEPENKSESAPEPKSESGPYSESRKKRKKANPILLKIEMNRSTHQN